VREIKSVDAEGFGMGVSMMEVNWDEVAWNDGAAESMVKSFSSEERTEVWTAG
jgi:hypothetical protein